jgi:heat shock protein HtpX
MKTALLMAALSALLLGCGHALAGGGGLLTALLLSGPLNFAAYRFSDRMVMRIHAAREIRPEEEPALFYIARELARRAGVPMPRLYLLDEEAPNAFATGRDPKHAAIAITVGLIRILTKGELAGVMAHELAHIKRRDTLVLTVAAAFATAFAGPALAPLGALLIQTSVSHTREFLADEAGARLVRNPLALAGALAKVEAVDSQVPLSSATAATAHLFIRNPLAGDQLSRLFQTHPPTSVRIERLEAMTLRRVAQEV